MHTLKWIAPLGLAILGLAFASARHKSLQNESKPDWKPLSMEEAEILAYLSPFGVDHRRAGQDVFVTRNCDVPAVAPPFLSLELVATKPFKPGGLEDHEYVVVNLNVAEVYDPIPIPARQLKSAELSGVADIMRKAHHIDAKVIEKYGSVQPKLQGLPPCK